MCVPIHALAEVRNCRRWQGAAGEQRLTAQFSSGGRGSTAANFVSFTGARTNDGILTPPAA